jgi:subtilisin family serine protease
VRLQVEALDHRVLLSGSTLGGLAVGPQAVSETSTAVSADRLFVRFKAEATLSDREAILSSLGASVVASYPDGPLLVELATPQAAEAAMETLRALPTVVYAELDAPLNSAEAAEMAGTIDAAAFYPSDPSFSRQWGLNNTNDIDIDAPQAWSVTTGLPVIVAVIDSGIDLRSTEFSGRILPGWNFLNGSSNVQDDYGHGTHVSGIIGASGNDGRGVSGVNWNALILPLKVLDRNGDGSTDVAVSAIYYAVAHGAKVINASWGDNTPSQALADAIAYAGSQGVVFVTAAGNDSQNNDFIPTYPPSYHDSNVLVVAAIDRNGNRASFSNYGASDVDLAAPGVDIYSTYRNGYQTLSGTSMATAYVSGVASLLAGLHPDWTAEQIVQRILATTKPLSTLSGITATGGMVDAAQALGVAGSGANSGGPAPQYLSPSPGRSFGLGAQMRFRRPPRRPFRRPAAPLTPIRHRPFAHTALEAHPRPRNAWVLGLAERPGVRTGT